MGLTCFFQTVPLIFRHLSNLGKIHLGFYCKPQRLMLTGCFRAANNTFQKVSVKLSGGRILSPPSQDLSPHWLFLSLPPVCLFVLNLQGISGSARSASPGYPPGMARRVSSPEFSSGVQDSEQGVKIPSLPCGSCVSLGFLQDGFDPHCARQVSGSDGWAETLSGWVRIPLDVALGSLPCSCARDTAPLQPTFPFHHHHPNLQRQLHSIIHNLTESC